MRFLFWVLKVFWKGKMYVWLHGYLERRQRAALVVVPQDKLIDVMVLAVDHFEPVRREGAVGVQRVKGWCAEYKRLAAEHRDSDGIVPKHTWFYRYDYPNFEILNALSKYVYEGFGEIEFHLHHGYDTPESFNKRVRDGVQWFNKVGAMISAEEVPRIFFGYIAGNWALDNGRKDPKFSGVNTEISVLVELRFLCDFSDKTIVCEVKGKRHSQNSNSYETLW